MDGRSDRQIEEDQSCLLLSWSKKEGDRGFVALKCSDL